MIKFSCDKNALWEAVTAANKGVAIKPTNPALEGILISAYDSVVKLTGYDMSLGVECTFLAQVITPGDIVVEAKVLTEIIRTLPSDTLTLTAGEDNSVNVVSGLADYNVMGIPKIEFPELFKVEHTFKFEISQTVLKNMLRQTAFAMAVNHAKATMNGTFFDINDDVLNIVASDGFRLSLRKENISVTNTKASFIIPSKTISEILKLLTDEERSIEIKTSQKHMSLQIDNVMLVSRLLEGEFMDYKSVIPSQSTTSTLVNVKNILSSIERVSLLLNEKMRAPVRCLFEFDAIKITSKTSLGNIYDEISSMIEGETLEIGFNDRFMADALRATENENVRLNMTTPTSPIIIRPENGDKFVMLVLPVRLKAE